MTDTQRTMLGIMVKLEKLNVKNLLTHFLAQCEKILLTSRLQCISPLSRLYLAVLKMQTNIHRMRRMCLDAVYFMGDLAVPFMNVVLTCWPDVIPHKHEENKGNVYLCCLVLILHFITKLLTQHQKILINLHKFSFFKISNVTLQKTTVLDSQTSKFFLVSKQIHSIIKFQRKNKLKLQVCCKMSFSVCQDKQKMCICQKKNSKNKNKLLTALLFSNKHCMVLEK